MKEKRTTFSIENFPGHVAELGRDLWMAGLGAITVVEEEGTKFYETLIDTSSKRLSGLQEEAAKVFDDLVKRGEKFEDRGRKQFAAVKEEVAAVSEDVTARPRAVAAKIEQTIAASVEKTLERLAVPTRTEVRNLTKTVERLTRQVAQLAAILEA